MYFHPETAGLRPVLFAALMLLVPAACSKEPQGPPETVIEFGTFKSPRCELEQVKDTFSLDSGMSMVVRSSRAFGSTRRYQLYLAELHEAGDGRQERVEIDRLLLDVDPAKTIFCAAGPKLTPRQFGIQQPGRYRMEFWIGEERMAQTDIFITSGS